MPINQKCLTCTESKIKKPPAIKALQYRVTIKKGETTKTKRITALGEYICDRCGTRYSKTPERVRPYYLKSKDIVVTAVAIIKRFWRSYGNRLLIAQRRALPINEFARWITTKRQGFRVKDFSLKVISLIWNNPALLGFIVEMGDNKRIYYFDMEAKFPGTNNLIWKNLDAGLTYGGFV